MSSNSIMAQDAGVLALLTDTSRAGYGSYGYGHGSFGNLSANAVRTDRVSDAVDRNGGDAHFFALSSQERSHFNILNRQTQENQLAEQMQVSQLALQLCRCCNDQKFELGKIEGRIECLGAETAHLLILANVNQDCQDLLGQIAAQQNTMNATQSNDQHAQILVMLGQIAGALDGMDGDSDGDGHGKRKRCRKCRCRECECGVTVNVRTVHGNNNFSDRGGGNGDIEDVNADESESAEDGDNGGDAKKTVNGRSAPSVPAIVPASKTPKPKK